MDAPYRNDPRMVYGALCTWWDTIDKAHCSHDRLPVCPFCGRPLFEMRNEEVWQESVDHWAETTDDADYPKYIAWLRGKCYPNHATARKDYEHV